jgi:hypothetical protein
MRVFKATDRPQPQIGPRRWIGWLLASITLVVLIFWLWPSPPLPEGARADEIVVYKSDRRLELLVGGETLKRYRVSPGWAPRGPETQQGDGKTPEGTYVIDFRKGNSAFHRALHISYPNAEDRRRAKQLGIPPGGGGHAARNEEWLGLDRKIAPVC